MYNVHEITKLFEAEVATYCGAKYCAALDNGSNAIFLALKYYFAQGGQVEINVPAHTYPSVPCEVLNAGGKIKFYPSPALLKGAYQLTPSNVWDSALWFSSDMYIKDSFMCLSFTGAYKTLKLGKGGAILTDNEDAYKWFKRKRFSGRNECSYHEDELDETGYNFYMMPEIAARGLLLMQQFYNADGTKKINLPIELPYPDLSTKKAYQ